MMKNVLFLAHSGSAGGAEYCLDTTLRFLDREKIEPYVIFPWEGPMVESARKMGIPVEICRLNWWFWYRPSGWEWKNRLRIPWYVGHLARRIRQKRIETVYSNTACLFEGALAARLAGVPHVTHIHEVLEERFLEPRWFSLPWMVRFFYRWSRWVVYESKESAEIGRKWLRDDSLFDAKTRVVSNSCRFLLPENHYRKRSPKAKKRILWVGTFSERKNPGMLVEALRRLKCREDWDALLVGAGPLEMELRTKIAGYGLESRCSVWPFQEEILPVLEEGDFLVLTSQEESFGLVLVEAGMLGLPVIATRTQGPTEIVEEGTQGFLVEPEDDRNLAEKITFLLEQDEKRREWGENFRNKILEKYHPAKNTAQLMDLL
ncbi:MAG: glycosyltransferase family 4 protein [Planctomycetia bacterium]|nr:glycosyltransferase family 4 protein [Planctomycetia bacterium]